MRDSKHFDLTPINGRNSFGGKAKVHQYTNDVNHVKSELLSYNTKVVTYNHTNNELTFLAKKEHLTRTTIIHINAFLDFYGFDKMTKEQILNN